MLNDTLTLCATRRLALTLRQQAPDGDASWQTPRVLSLGQWLDALADEAAVCAGVALPALLDDDACRLLWEQVIADALARQGNASAALFDPAGLAATAREADALCLAWQMPAGGDTDEARGFADWQAAFLARCAALDVIDAGRRMDRLTELVASGALLLPARIELAGFDRPTRQEERLFSTLAAQGVTVSPRPFFTVDRENPVVFACTDRREECLAAVAWAQAQLTDNPSARLGIVALDLAAVRDELTDLLDAAFHPQALRPDGAELPRCYNLSLGKPLAAAPVVATALELLALGDGLAPLEQPRLSTLLLGAFWQGSDSEADARAGIDAALRRTLPWSVSPRALLRLGERLDLWTTAPRTGKALQAGLAAADPASRRQLPGAWAADFLKTLDAFGWPGERVLSSHEFQAWQAFLTLLEGFARYDRLLGPVNRPTALARLRELARQRLFQPETRGEPSIQILGLLESAGLTFDALWVMGLHDAVWPAAPRPNPLLPVTRQRAAGSSHASAEVELDFARRVQARLCRAAPSVCLSWPGAEGNRLLRPSPLLNGPFFTVDREKLPSSLAHTLLDPSACELLDDAQAPPVADGEHVAGGSGLLRAQAICPAWAFYQYRLGAQALKTPVEGLDPAARGTLVHGALEVFWRATGDSRTLAGLTPAAREAALHDAIEAALVHFEAGRRSPLPPRFRQLEAQRLYRLLDRWLAFEATRPDPFTVVACEQAAELALEGIAVRLVVDRIDRLEDGREVILDYKTGATIDTRNWSSDRLTEPQLPIYAALVNDNVAAVCFAKVLPDAPALSGVAEDGDLLPGVRGLGDPRQKTFPPDQFPDWVAVVTHWRGALHAVAREVREGVAAVRVTDPADLAYCEVLPLLRLPERQRLLRQHQEDTAP